MPATGRVHPIQRSLHLLVEERMQGLGADGSQVRGWEARGESPDIFKSNSQASRMIYPRFQVTFWHPPSRHLHSCGVNIPTTDPRRGCRPPKGKEGKSDFTSKVYVHDSCTLCPPQRPCPLPSVVSMEQSPGLKVPLLKSFFEVQFPYLHRPPL